MGLRIPAARVLTDVAFGAVFALPVLVFTGAIAVALSQVFQPPPNPLPEALSPFDLVANLLSAAVIAPIGEELFFRGYATTAGNAAPARARRSSAVPCCSRSPMS
jgi:membrane protease YdiL (CAAX protease family)